VVAASGMVTGGRILLFRTLHKFTWDYRDYSGHQAEGTREATLEGAEEVKIYGKYYPVEAKILEIEGHALRRPATNWFSPENKT
jgi:metallo-beta-lactamase family protein